MGGLRFAFYGRVSTAEFQESESSRRWQRDVAKDLVGGHGRIVVEFFDTDRSRCPALAHRPEAPTLLRSLADPNRSFDAIVIGEYERAFYGDQVLTLLPALEEHGVPLSLPEAHGPIDPNSDPSGAAMLLGATSCCWLVSRT